MYMYHVYRQIRIYRISADGEIHPIYTRELPLFCDMGTEFFSDIYDIIESDISELCCTVKTRFNESRSLKRSFVKSRIHLEYNSIRNKICRFSIHSLNREFKEVR